MFFSIHLDWLVWNGNTVIAGVACPTLAFRKSDNDFLSPWAGRNLLVIPIPLSFFLDISKAGRNLLVILILLSFFLDISKAGRNSTGHMAIEEDDGYWPKVYLCRQD